MTRRDRLFSFIETTLQAVKFRGVWFGIVFVYHAVRMRFILKDGPGHYTFLGYTMYFDNKWSVINMWFELFGQQVYFFETKVVSPFIVDVGANIGDSVIYFKWLYPQARIIAFEPNPKAFALLEKNIQANSLRDVRAYQVAVGSTESQIILKDDGLDVYNTGTISSTKHPTSHNVQVPQIRLSQHIGLREVQNIDLLKLDIEGAEGEAFKDIGSLLPKTDEVVLEYHLTTDVKENSFDIIANALTQNRFLVRASGFYRYVKNLGDVNVLLIAKRDL